MKRESEESSAEGPKRSEGETTSSSSFGSGGGAISAAAVPDSGYPADWTCAKCNDINFARRHVCRKCLAPREGGGASAAVPSSDGFFKTGDWNCACGEHNFASRTMCRKCNAAKNVSSVTPLSRVNSEPDGNFKSGDWMCPKCNDHNYATRSMCRQCMTPKPAEVAPGQRFGGGYSGAAGGFTTSGFGGYGGGPGGYGYGGSQGVASAPYGGMGAYGMTSYAGGSYGQMPGQYAQTPPPATTPQQYGGGGGGGGGDTVESYGQAAQSYDPYGTGSGATNTSAAAAPLSTEPWSCYKCHTLNNPIWEACPSCAAPKDRNKAEGNWKNGDWKCPRCGEHCFASRSTCRVCQYTNGSAVSVAMDPAMSSGNWKPGDWTCSCGDHNFATRAACRKCNKPRPGGPMVAPVGGFGFKVGDWSCPACNDHNFASRTSCRKCGANKS